MTSGAAMLGARLQWSGWRRVLAIGAVGLVGAVVGFMISTAFAEDIVCSHEYSSCNGTAYADDIEGWENINEILARENRDRAYGYAQQDFLWGSTDADALYGGNDADTVKGESGNDSYLVVTGGKAFGAYGNSGWDLVEGNEGQDYVEGGLGEDNMKGGDDKDALFARDGQADLVDGGAGAEPQWCWLDLEDSWIACEPVGDT